MNIIKKNEDIALSNYEIDKKLDGKTKVLKYSALRRFNNINDLLEPYKNFILLFMSKPNYGHWTCVLKHSNKIEYFDPYGGQSNYPDTILDKIDNNIKKETNQNYPYLTKLLYNSNYPIEYNNYRFQEMGNSIKTCGRHCIVRILLKDLELEEYYNFMHNLSKSYKMNYDEIVTIITMKI
jgi:hypothetical protein